MYITYAYAGCMLYYFYYFYYYYYYHLFIYLCSVIAAAGNAGNSGLLYPAAYPSVIAVAAVDADGIRPAFSQCNDQVEIAAP